jgi:hypothetical protein
MSFALAYPGIIFRGGLCPGGGSINTLRTEDRGKGEWGSGGGRPLVRGSAQFANE